MLTKNIKFLNFRTEGKKKLIEKQLISKFNYYSNHKLIKSFSKYYTYSFEKKKIQKYKKFNNFNIIGMGGSSLGAKAIYNFLKNKIKKKFIFIDNINLNKKINSKIKTLNIIISKSGNTLETISNFNNLKNKKNNLFICENSNNKIIEHRNYIGGRYSVLSEVGMLPSILMGLNEKKFKSIDHLIKNKNFKNLLIRNVSSIFSLINKKKLK